MLHPNLIKHVTLDGHSLTLESFIAVARFGASVELSSEAMRLMEESRALADRISQEGRVAYGITTASSRRSPSPRSCPISFPPT